ncbi:MAG: hypothetical protein WCI71_06070 [Bacteroidota bacterium]
MIRLSPERLSFHLIWIFALLEMITVPLVTLLPLVFSIGIKSPLEGAVVGFLGVVILFLILNRIIDKLNITIDGLPVTGISILSAALWNMFFLALIFGLQKVIGLIRIDSWIIQNIMAGFFSVSGAVLITIAAYHAIYNFIVPMRISVKAGAYSYSVRRMSVVTIALLAGGYEALALPVILIWQQAESNIPLFAAFTGMAGGVLGSAAIVFLYNYVKIPRIYFVFEKG